MKKPLFITFLIAVIVVGPIFVSGINFGLAQNSNGSSENGIINSDTTWTKANSPYTLTGPVAINTGVTLTIQPGVTVNLNGYYIQVNGTLVARGSSTDNIYFNEGTLASTQNSNSNGPITFNQDSGKWNEQTGSGSIIENAVLQGLYILINDASPKINNNTIIGGITAEGSSIISNNIVDGGIGAASGSPIIFNNIITNSPSAGLPTTGIGIGQSNAVVFNNTISGCYTGISVSGENPIISNNFVSNGKIGINVDLHNGGSVTVKKNLISGNSIAGVQILGGSPLIKDNTITNNSVGIIVNYEYGVYFQNFTPIPNPSIVNNNVYANSNYNFKSGISNNIDVTSNWWGTTDQSAINQSIYDNKNDFNVGKVNFVPFVAEANSQAAPDPNAPVPTPMVASSPSPSASASPTSTATPSPSTTPSQTATQRSGAQTTTLFGLDWTIIALIVLSVVVALLIAVIAFMRRRRVK